MLNVQDIYSSLNAHAIAQTLQKLKPWNSFRRFLFVYLFVYFFPLATTLAHTSITGFCSFNKVDISLTCAFKHSTVLCTVL